MKSLKPYLPALAWGLAIAVSFLAVFKWGSDLEWHIPFNAYVIFPVLGLTAYSIMWTHYVVGALRDLSGTPAAKLRHYYQYTGYLVLGLICLHPGLLIYQRFRDGHGLPPGSYESYVAPGLGWITLLGTLSLLIFLAFEFRRVFGSRSWWHFVPEAGDAAMLLIFYHSLRLGSQLPGGWFRSVWWFYGLTLTAVLARSYAIKFRLIKQTRA